MDNSNRAKRSIVLCLLLNVKGAASSNANTLVGYDRVSVSGCGGESVRVGQERGASNLEASNATSARAVLSFGGRENSC